ncbi:MAG: histidine kinase N-terminal 7TM domain-containing protein [Candidatus Kerfeldbacteria bacterium]
MVIGYILLTLSLVELILGVFFLTRYKNQQSTFWFGLFCFGSAIYVGSNGMGFISHVFNNAEEMSWLGGMIATAMFLPFSTSFPFPQRNFREQVPWAVWPAVIFSTGLIFSDAFIVGRGITRFTPGYMTQPGQLFWFMNVVLVFYWIWSLVNLFRTFKKSDGIIRKNLRLILFGILVSLLFSIFFDVVLPLVTVNIFGYVGSVMTSAWLGMTSYILVAKK